ncbi:MAG: formylglycine-generating enzyme family protein [Fibrobacterota bacterium]|nr:formylglycine-generating enzyme family protein [Fibrobacterota bacterium]
MNRSLLIGLVLAVAAISAVPMAAPKGMEGIKGIKGMALVPGGTLVLPFREDSANIRIKVEAFQLDRHPVTNDEFRSFLKAKPDLARSRIKPLFADPAYLADWKGDTTPREGTGRSPVTQVSWYAAKAYCSHAGKRLPTTAEWEWAAKALPPGMDSTGLAKTILAWYAKPAGGSSNPGSSHPQASNQIGSGSLNGNGIRDLFGLVWEWTSDFDAFGFAGMNQRGVAEGAAFCGAGSARATKEAEYAVYMRWAFRLSLRADYSVGSLGFRCARNKDEIGK